MSTLLHLDPFTKGYVNNLLCPCVFIKRTKTGCVIIDFYVDDLNITGTNKEIIETLTFLKNELKMKDIDKMEYCLELKIEHLKDGIFVHQSN